MPHVYGMPRVYAMPHVYGMPRVYGMAWQIHGLCACSDFQTPWTAGQFHHMNRACQEDRMFFFGRKSERDLTPKVALGTASPSLRAAHACIPMRILTCMACALHVYTGGARHDLLL